MRAPTGPTHRVDLPAFNVAVADLVGRSCRLGQVLGVHSGALPAKLGSIETMLWMSSASPEALPMGSGRPAEA